MEISSLHIPYLPWETIQQYADEFRDLFGCGKFPVDVDLIAEKAGIDLQPIPSLKYLCSMEACISNNSKIIFYDYSGNDLRLRFSIAHELGHFKLHRDEIQLLRPNSFDDWSNILEEIPLPTINRFEVQADEFAGRLLVPISKLKESFIIVKNDLLEMKGFFGGNYFSTFGFISPALAKFFNVSDKVMKKRLEKESINPFEFI
ncbi:MAG TPA: ImmA/IrrE family metallo-endopeptidase [Ignavibacteriaceae bacterium]|nr:ImmA/IrrE family metallo-endopeptidase [Ignavibacteriaceae bacterium]